MDILRKVFHWFLVIVFFFCMLAGFRMDLPGVGVLFLALMILVLPFQNLPWNQMDKGKRAGIYLICLVLLFVGFAIMSQHQTANQKTSSLNTEGEYRTVILTKKFDLEPGTAI